MNYDLQVLLPALHESLNNQIKKKNVKPNEIVFKLNPLLHSIINQNGNTYRAMKKNSTRQRIFFTKEEDQKIIELVKTFGTRHWQLIAQFVEGRSAKQCRDRYSNYLVPGFFHGEWTIEEDNLLTHLFNNLGPKWSIIKKSFPHRSTNMIKNRWYYFLHRKTQNIESNEQINSDKNNQFEMERFEANCMINDIKMADFSTYNFDSSILQNEDTDYLLDGKMNHSFPIINFDF